MPADIDTRMIYQLIYGSTARHPMTKQELLTLLAAARVNNARRDVTGLLLYHDGTFLQVLEGPRETVEKLLKHISRDQRHHGVSVFYQGECAAREFGDWSMAFHAPEDGALAERMAGFQQLKNVAAAEARGKQVRAFIRSFRLTVRLSDAA